MSSILKYTMCGKNANSISDCNGGFKVGVATRSSNPLIGWKRCCDTSRGQDFEPVTYAKPSVYGRYKYSVTTAHTIHQVRRRRLLGGIFSNPERQYINPLRTHVQVHRTTYRSYSVSINTMTTRSMQNPRNARSRATGIRKCLYDNVSWPLNFD